MAAELFVVERFAALLFAAAGFELFVVDFDVLALVVGFFVVLLDAVFDAGLRLRDDFGRATRTGRFQPTALSARNVRGIEMTFSGLSMTEATAASARSARTSEITFAGRRARAA